MAHLTLAGLSDDGRRLLLVSARGVEFTLDVDDRLKAALSGDHARLGQLEIKMDSALRPRDIQSRIRAGETPEAVAQAAHTTVEAIMPFAAPVIAERQHVADRAQRASVRRTGAPGGGARTLGDAVGSHLRSAGVNPDTVDWDAARREDGKWTLTAAFSAGARHGIARFVFDAPGNYAVADNDDATWLVGDAPAAAAAPPPVSDDIARARARRAAATEPDAEELLPLGDDAISMVSPETSVEAYLEEVPAESDAAPEEPASEEVETPAARDAEPPARKPARKRGRASVPSWDEIMFGGGKSE
ncbi:septation protein SepH [Nocardioides aestuarii]|uniref:Septation protein SepH n=1 Tax=Nocardioides aestuarii TaxID=252231 RepID=A0ABW4THK3_9ACTN